MRDIQNLEPFVQAVRCGSFIAAASQLKVTPPAISKSIAKLERDLGVRLFNRTTRKLHLTNEGRELFQRIGPLLSGIDEALSVVTQSPQDPEGVVKVSTTPTFGRYCLMPTITEFFKLYPKVELEISFDEIAPSLVEAGVDVSIQHTRGRRTSHVSRLLCEYPLVLVASPDYLAHHGTPEYPEDLEHHNCIGIQHLYGKAALHLERIRQDPHYPSRKRGERYVHNPRGPLTVANQLDASLIAALYGAGITASSLPAVFPYLKSGRLKLVLPDYRIKPKEAAEGHSQIFIHYPHRKHLPAKVRVFVDYLTTHFRTHTESPEALDIFSA